MSETRRVNEGEYQSLVADAEENERAEDADETRSESSSLDEDTLENPMRGASIMSNADARTSQVDVHTRPVQQQGGGSISEKAGIILVA